MSDPDPNRPYRKGIEYTERIKPGEPWVPTVPVYVTQPPRYDWLDTGEVVEFSFHGVHFTETMLNRILESTLGQVWRAGGVDAMLAALESKEAARAYLRSLTEKKPHP